MDGQMLRQQIYTDWLQRKRSFTKEESKLRKEKNEKEHEDKERAGHERKVDVSFFFQEISIGVRVHKFFFLNNQISHYRAPVLFNKIDKIALKI